MRCCVTCYDRASSGAINCTGGPVVLAASVAHPTGRIGDGWVGGGREASARASIAASSSPRGVASIDLEGCGTTVV